MWALPTVGWLLMVSSMARSKVFLWAVGTPLVTALLLLWAEKAMHIGINSAWFVSNIVCRLLLSVVPGAWLLFDDARVLTANVPHRLPVPQIFAESWSTLGNANVWIGVAAGHLDAPPPRGRLIQRQLLIHGNSRVRSTNSTRLQP
jgi:ABC-2 type transport system permease protein